MPSINTLHEERAGQGLTVLLVNISESRETVARAVKARAYAAPVLLDTEGETATAYGVRGTPTVFLVGRDGAVLGRAIGARPWTQSEGRALLDAVLTPGPPANR